VYIFLFSSPILEFVLFKWLMEKVSYGSKIIESRASETPKLNQSELLQINPPGKFEMNSTLRVFGTNFISLNVYLLHKFEDIKIIYLIIRFS